MAKVLLLGSRMSGRMRHQMGKFVHASQDAAKSTGRNVVLWLLRALLGLLVGLTMTLVGQEIFSYESFSFFLVLSVFTLLVMRITRNMGFFALALFTLIVILSGTALKLYVEVAPG